MVHFAGENRMKNVRGFALGLVLGLGVALGGLAFAQNTSDQKKKPNHVVRWKTAAVATRVQ
jgi:hypothetical protein